MRINPFVLVVCVGLVCLGAYPRAMAFPGDDWLPIDPAELAQKTPVVEKDADAEALFWQVRVLDEVGGETPRTVLRNYIRIKVYTERGRESQSKIDIPYLNNWSIKDIAARTIKTDGTIIEIKKEDILERTIVKESGLKIKAKSFALRGVEPGAIIEYRWREVRNDQLSFYIRLQLQRDVPVQIVKYYIKPLSLPGFPFGMRVQTFHTEATPFVKEKDGFYSKTMRDVPAFREEARMPPENSVRPWMLVYYSEDRKLTGDSFWKDYGKRQYEENKSRMKVGAEVKEAAAAAIGDSTGPEEKLERLFEFCRSKIKNVNDDASGMTTEERAKLKENKSPADTLKRGMGTGTDIDMLFAALAQAAGFEARIVNLADRSDVFFDRGFADDYFIHAYDIAVRVGDEWRFYDPASTYVPLGMLRWQEESQDALLSDPKEPIWLRTPISPPEKSKEKRIAKLRLLEDGTIEGDVRIEYYGHLAVERKEWDDDDSPAQREETLRDSVKSRMSTAELSEIKIENVNDGRNPFVYNYHVRVAGYAQRTGKRLFLQPAFFQRGVAPLFPTSERKHAVYFHYPWSEEDEVTIDLPEGFALDNAEAPAPFAAPPISAYKPTLRVTKDGRTLNYKREFYFGGGGNILFPVSGYSQLKQFFDVLNKQDGHTITLRQSSVAASQ
ncbi:MAG TPA: DUF3857 domain-containing protein [Pyrinomonadaceae bacterium]|nr:DUF3857 domain-containing protein [Pyrinomonadaceae bacterium]